MVLLGFLGWTVLSGADTEGDLRVQIVLGIGVVYGIIYAAYGRPAGRLPDWIIDLSEGTLVHDDDPSNISPRVYLPIIFAVVLVAVLAFGYFVGFSPWP